MQEIRPLTSLRGFAALAVVMQHFSATAQAHTRVTIPSLVPHGYMAVDFFFVLSGFIMCLIYLNDFQVRGLQAFPSFLMKRVARIAPLNVAVLLALMIAGVASRAILKSNIFFDDSAIAFDLPANLLMLQGLGIGNPCGAVLLGRLDDAVGVDGLDGDRHQHERGQQPQQRRAQPGGDAGGVACIAQRIDRGGRS